VSVVHMLLLDAIDAVAGFVSLVIFRRCVSCGVVFREL
jgi:hypothetical protein